MATCRPPPPKLLDLDLTIVSAKHLKNVNWKNGDLKAYAVFWVDPDRRLATKSDDSGSTRPVWNERFTLPLSLPLHDSYFTLEIFHSKPSETPKPLVGTLRIGLRDLPDPDDSTRIRSFELVRPSGRPQGKIRIKVGVRERPLPPPQVQDYHITPPQSYYYSTAPMPPAPRDYRYGTASPPPPPLPSLQYSSYHHHHDTYNTPPSPYYSGYYSAPPIPPRPLFDRNSNNNSVYSGGGGPSAPVDYSVSAAGVGTSSFDQRQKGVGKVGFGTGLAVGALAGGIGGLALDEGLKYEEEKIAERVEHDIAAAAASRDDYSDYRVDY